METIQFVIQYLLHIDTYLLSFVANYGLWTYAVLFAIIFCETGLVIFPFLPGDSLLFTAGSIAASANQPLNIQLLFLLLLIASILGNKINYLAGRFMGARLFSIPFLFNQKYLAETHRFYERHGGKTIVFARFIPIIRTFAPFVAGMGEMSIKRFSFYNILSAILWIGSLTGAGYLFGTLPFIQQHFTFVLYGIIFLSVLPPICTFLYRKLSTTG